jgi:integrase/recombinase XerD
MSDLLDKMELQLALKGRSPATVSAYLRYARAFEAFHGCSPDEMGEPEVRAWLAHLMEEKKARPDLLRVHIAALRYLYGEVLGRPDVVAWVPWPRKVKRLPKILSHAEVNALLDAAVSPRMRVMIMAGYGAGLRITEACSLRIEDVDSKRGLLFLHKTKGNKDRVAPLPQRLLLELREWWRLMRPPGPWLFPGRDRSRHITRQAVNIQFIRTKQAAGVTREVVFHSLRHAFATHLLEEGVDLLTIQELLGHVNLTTSLRYMRVRVDRIKAVGSPLDRLPPA